MNIHEARENTTHVMNAKSIIENLDNFDGETIMGDSRAVLDFSKAYYGGFNVGGSSNFDNLRH